jgi:helix-turn-helix, Psq domain
MRLAVQSVRSGTLNLFRASKEFGIPRNTLRARVYGDESKSHIKKKVFLGITMNSCLLNVSYIFRNLALD